MRRMAALFFCHCVIFFSLISLCSSCIKYFPPDKNVDDDYFGLPSVSKRNKDLDCTCGKLPQAGTQNTDFHFPWHVLIVHVRPEGLQPTGKICSGTLINDRVILTTSSCILKVMEADLLAEPSKPLLFPDKLVLNSSEIRVLLTYDMSLNSEPDENKLLKICHVYYHPLFLFRRGLHNKVDYDIALLTLKNPLELGSMSTKTKAIPVCLPPKFLDEELVGVQVEFTSWTFKNSFKEDPPTSAHIYERMRCRVNMGTNWVSNRLICTIAPEFVLNGTTRPLDSGKAWLVQSGDQYVQYGIHSLSSDYPLMFQKKPISLATNVAGFLRRIDDYSAKMGGRWCTRGLSHDEAPPKSKDFDNTFVNSRADKYHYPWEGVTSDNRNVLKSCSCGLVNSKIKGRIERGEDAVPYEYGWQVQLLIKNADGDDNLCGATLINDRVVLTAGHCVTEQNKNKTAYTVKPGDIKVWIHRYNGPSLEDDQSIRVEVKTIIPHPNFELDGAERHDDVALIILSEPVSFSTLKGKVSPLCFPNTDEDLQLVGREDAMTIGWGRTNQSKGSNAKKLQQLRVKVISKADCVSLLEKLPAGAANDVKSYDDKICAGNFKKPAEYMDALPGDSGGPLFLPIRPGSDAMVHIGITSAVTVLFQANNPNAPWLKDLAAVVIYTRSQAFLDFVDYYSLLAGANWCSRP